ncbi:MAG TPA: hypothetical protein VHU44_02400 [Acidobacteriaceae bacterium]|jgi:hypothetical protein|nr:hypothetical protein [Acidobacteriaceae bacterium]
MQDKYDAAINKTLATLGSATPPEGMETRIHQRLQYRAAQTNLSDSWRPGRAWWQGLLTGATVATILCCAVAFGLYAHLAGSGRENPQVSMGSPRTGYAAATPASSRAGIFEPCVQPAIRQQARHGLTPRVIRAALETPPLRTPASDELTPQERELVRLAQVGDPKQLSEMSFEARARVDAQQSAAFEMFFTPPPPPPHDEGVNE